MKKFNDWQEYFLPADSILLDSRFSSQEEIKTFIENSQKVSVFRKFSEDFSFCEEYGNVNCGLMIEISFFNKDSTFKEMYISHANEVLSNRIASILQSHESKFRFLKGKEILSSIDG